MPTPTLAHLRIQRRLLAVMPYVIVLLFLLVIFLTTRLAATTQEVRTTSAYTRVSNCIVAKNAYTEIKQSDVEKCYQQVEKDSKIKLQRFDNQTSAQPTNH